MARKYWDHDVLDGRYSNHSTSWFSFRSCNEAKKDFISAEKEWSSVNADITS